MKFIHYQVQAGPENQVVVRLDKQANVLLLDDCQFQNYRRGRRYTYRGGLAKTSPFCIQPPHSGRWNVVVNLGGHSGRVNASCSVQK